MITPKSEESSRILTIDGESYLLPVSVSDADAFKLLAMLTGVEKVRDRIDYIPDAESEYATRAIILADKRVDVEMKITHSPLYSKPAFEEARKAGQEIYDAAHPSEIKMPRIG